MTEKWQLPKRFETIVTALDAIGDDDPSFTFDEERSHLLQEKKGFVRRESSNRSPETAARVNRMHIIGRKPNKTHCTHNGKKNHTELYRWAKYGRPTNGKSRKQGQFTPPTVIVATAAVATERKEEEARDEVDFYYVYLMTFNETDKPSSRYADWRKGATGHMTFDRSAFSSYEEETPFPVHMGNKSVSFAVGREDVHVYLHRKGTSV